VLLGTAVVASAWIWAALLQRWRGGGVLALLNGLLAAASLSSVACVSGGVGTSGAASVTVFLWQARMNFWPPLHERAPMMDRVAIERAMGLQSHDLARKVIGGFLEDIPRQVSTLKACLEAGDVAGASRQAHSTKSASASVGGEALSHLALDMEKAARAGDLKSVAARVPELEMQIARFREAVVASAG
jgi:HPt (histidine-containing phosphotransfer) domain-containing protein